MITNNFGGYVPPQPTASAAVPFIPNFLEDHGILAAIMIPLDDKTTVSIPKVLLTDDVMDDMETLATINSSHSESGTSGESTTQHGSLGSVPGCSGRVSSVRLPPEPDTKNKVREMYRTHVELIKTYHRRRYASRILRKLLRNRKRVLDDASRRIDDDESLIPSIDNFVVQTEPSPSRSQSKKAALAKRARQRADEMVRKVKLDLEDSNVSSDEELLNVSCSSSTFPIETIPNASINVPSCQLPSSLTPGLTAISSTSTPSSSLGMYEQDEQVLGGAPEFCGAPHSHPTSGVTTPVIGSVPTPSTAGSSHGFPFCGSGASLRRAASVRDDAHLSLEATEQIHSMLDEYRRLVCRQPDHPSLDFRDITLEGVVRRADMMGVAQKWGVVKLVLGASSQGLKVEKG